MGRRPIDNRAPRVDALALEEERKVGGVGMIDQLHRVEAGR